MLRICGLDMMVVLHVLHGIGETDITDVEGLERMDRMDVRIDRPRLHFEVTTAASRSVTQPANNYVPTPVR